MFVRSENYQEAINSVLATTGELFVAVAFWGRGAEQLFSASAARRLKIVCNLRSGATNPDTIEALRRYKNIQLRQHDRLHAKVMVSDSGAVIGSANLSCNGLNLEGEEVQGWEEAGFFTREAEHIAETKQWFDTMWRESQAVTPDDLDAARRLWTQRRGSRKTNLSTKRSGQPVIIGGMTRRELRDRPIYLAISRYRASEEAEAALRQKIIELKDQAATSSSDRNIMAYENWSSLPKETWLIDLYYGPRGAFHCGGVFMRVFDHRFKYSDGRGGRLQVCRRERSILGLPIRSQELDRLSQRLRPAISGIWNSGRAKGGESAKIISLSEALDITG